MLKQPLFKPHFQVEVAPPDRVYLFTEKARFLLKGARYARLAPLLDGRRTVDEIAAALQPHDSIFAVYQALLRLEERGYLTEAVDPATLGMSTEAAAFWYALGVEPTGTAPIRLSLSCIGAADHRAYAALLAERGVTVAADAPLHLVLTDDYLRPELEAINAEALRMGRPWLLAKPEGAVVWLGPLFVPRETGCWACLAQRLRGHRLLQAAVNGHGHALGTGQATNYGIGARLAATEAARWARQGEHEQLRGQVRTLDLTNLSWQEHRLVKRPQCPVCGEPTATAVPIELQSSPKFFTADGGHRICPPEQMVAAYSHHISPICGIVGETVQATLPEITGHVYAAAVATPVLHGRETLDDMADNLVAAGKGRTDMQARASLLGEAIERYSAHYCGDDATVHGSYREMGPDAVHPNMLLQYSQRQLEHAAAGLVSETARHAWVGQPFDEERVIEWTPVWSLTAGRVRYVPTALCYFRYPYAPDHHFGAADSNGYAAGNSVEEAILQGFMELVERDSVAIWWYNRLARPRVDLASFSDPFLSKVQGDMAQLGRELWVLDLTTDLQIPAFAAVTRRIDQPAEEILMGFGAHFDANVALSRAVTETYQMLGQFDYSRRNREVSETIEWLTTASLAQHPYLAPDHSAPCRTAADYARPMNDDIRTDIHQLVENVAALGMETLVLDATRPDIGLTVVKVFVPGLRHFWARFAPGRLYDVPVRMGWLDQPLPETSLNPVAMFL